MCSLKEACGDELADIRITLRLIKNTLDLCKPNEVDWGDISWIVGSLEQKLLGLTEAIEGRIE